MDPRRLAFWLLTTAGVAVGHVAGYAVAHPAAAAREAALGGHEYLPGAAAVAVPLGVVAALVWAVRTSRDLGLAGSLRVRHLAAAQVAVFAAQEVGERAVTGLHPSDALVAAVGERGVWFGLAAQVLVAAASVRAVGLVRRLARAVTTGPRRRLLAAPPAPLVPVAALARPATLRTVAPVGRRGPPATARTR